MRFIACDEQKPAHPISTGRSQTAMRKFATSSRGTSKNVASLELACAIYHNGVFVVDLWGGCRNLECQLPWEEDTLICVFSTSKGLAAMTLAVAHSRGLLDLDRPVAAYWPEVCAK